MNIQCRAALFLLLILTVFRVAAEVEVVGFGFGLNTWVSEGQTKWRHDASAIDSDYGVPSSELDYQGISSEIAELSGVLVFDHDDRVYITLGLGTINEGILIDDDYWSATGAVNQSDSRTDAHRFSRTHSDITGDGLFYLQAEFSPGNMVFQPSFGRFRLSFGLQYWREKYEAQGIRQIECTSTILLWCSPAGTSSRSGKTVITNTVSWTGLGASIDGQIPLFAGLAAEIDFTFYPLMSLVNEDIHHLRPDLAQDPSIRMTGTGMGYDLTAGLRYRFTDNFSLNLQYRVWQRWVKNQKITFYGAGGGYSSARLMDFTSWRDGWTSGVELAF